MKEIIIEAHFSGSGKSFKIVPERALKFFIRDEEVEVFSFSHFRNNLWLGSVIKKNEYKKYITCLFRRTNEKRFDAVSFIDNDLVYKAKYNSKKKLILYTQKLDYTTGVLTIESLRHFKFKPISELKEL
jgi:hypothetical protein